MSGVGPTRLPKPSALALAGLASLCLSTCAAPEDTEQAPIRLVGHRGALGLAPENTLAALERAAVLGLREVDVVGRTAKKVAHERLDPDQAIAAAAERSLQCVVLAVADLTEPRVREARGAGLEIRAFHLEEVAELERLIRLGVEAVTVARPDRAQAYLAARFGS